MKTFFQTFFAVLFAQIFIAIGLVVIGVFAVFVLIGAVAAGAKSGGGASKELESGSYLTLNLSTSITDKPEDGDEVRALRAAFGGDDSSSLSLRRTLQGIRDAAADSKVAGIYLSGSLSTDNYGSGYAALKEIREALQEFQKSEKPVVAYLVDPSLRDYYLASVADEIYLHPFGALDLAGLASQPMFLKGAFDKYGIGVQVTRVGKYKSAVEPFLLDKMSPENREQTEALLGDIWNESLLAIAESRGLTVEQIQAISDSDGAVMPEKALEAKLVTKLAQLPEVLTDLKDRTGVTDHSKPFKQMAFTAYLAKKDSKDPFESAADSSSEKIAVIYAEGEIANGSGNEGIDGDRYARAIRKFRLDSTVKAIVLRVNSPGGSVLASEQIREELRLAREEAHLPVIVSMGHLAASGGYWISTASDRIFAEPNTITGSIGVFGLLPNIQKLANDNGVTFDTVKTGRFADIYTASRPKDAAELGLIQGYIDKYYADFKNRVAESRSLPLDHVQEIAQGRVWSGKQAIELGLVDEIGGLEAAIDFARTQAKAPTAELTEYPGKKQLAEQLTEIFEGKGRPVSQINLRGSLGDQLRQAEASLRTLENLDDPKGAYALLPFSLSLPR